MKLEMDDNTSFTISVIATCAAAMNNLIAAGHDALIMGGGDEIVVWDTNKIKITAKA